MGPPKRRPLAIRPRRPATAGDAQSRWDVWLPRASHVAQVLLFILAFAGYFLTVRPIYQKERLEEEMARLRIERDKEQKAFEGRTGAMRDELARIRRDIDDKNRELAKAETALMEVRKQAEEFSQLAGARYKSLRSVVAESFAYRASAVCLRQKLISEAFDTLIKKKAASETAPPPLKPTLKEFAACVRTELGSYSSATQVLTNEDQAKLVQLVEALPARIPVILENLKSLYPDKFKGAKGEGFALFYSFGDVVRWETALRTALDELVREFLAA